jgi:hypothetical protein
MLQNGNAAADEARGIPELTQPGSTVARGNSLPVENTQAVCAELFDYTTVAPELVEKLRAQAQRLRSRIAKSTEGIIEIGRDLLAVKDNLEHGQFLHWVEAEIGIVPRTAQTYMAAARLFDQYATVAYLPPATLYRLAAKSTPVEIVTQVVSKVEAGEFVSDAAVKSMIADANSQKREAKAKQRRAERHTKEYRQKREALDRQLKERYEQEQAKVATAVADLIRKIGKSGATLVLEIIASHRSYYICNELEKQLADYDAKPSSWQMMPPASVDGALGATP